jgi:hypothetical protein
MIARAMLPPNTEAMIITIFTCELSDEDREGTLFGLKMQVPF